MFVVFFVLFIRKGEYIFRSIHGFGTIERQIYKYVCAFIYEYINYLHLWAKQTKTSDYLVAKASKISKTPCKYERAKLTSQISHQSTVSALHIQLNHFIQGHRVCSLSSVSQN